MSPHLLIIPTEKAEDSTYIPANATLTAELGTIGIFKHPGSRKATLVMFVVWISVTLGKIEYIPNTILYV